MHSALFRSFVLELIPTVNFSIIIFTGMKSKMFDFDHVRKCYLMMKKIDFQIFQNLNFQESWLNELDMSGPLSLDVAITLSTLHKVFVLRSSHGELNTSVTVLCFSHSTSLVIICVLSSKANPFVDKSH